jgi:hypothetical protein
LSSKGLESASFDTFNPKKMHAEQIKACSVEGDLTSFGPKSKWDKIYFLYFFNEGKVDGEFDVYEIDSDLIYEMKMNKIETFVDQQKRGVRPRFSIKKLIDEKNIKPIATNVRVWL